MEQLHEKAIPIRAERGIVGWQVETDDFVFQAIESIDGRIDSYVIWGDDQPIDMAQHHNWSNVKQWLDTLLERT